MERIRTCPGIILDSSFTGGVGVHRYSLARRMKIGYNDMDLFMKGEYPLSDLMAEVLAEEFGTSVELWLGLEEKYRKSLP